MASFVLLEICGLANLLCPDTTQCLVVGLSLETMKRALFDVEPGLGVLGPNMRYPDCDFRHSEYGTYPRIDDHYCWKQIRHQS